MSKALFWQYNEFIRSRKEKLVNMLISEIIFLKTRIERADNKDEVNYLKNALKKLDYLSNKLRNYSIHMSREDFDKVIMLIYHIFKEIADNLERQI